MTSPKPAPCSQCGGPTWKVIFFGLPGRLCQDEVCGTLDGLAQHAPPVVTQTLAGPRFAFMVYEGGYIPALWRWLRGV